jgi:hypothetical protein
MALLAVHQIRMMRCAPAPCLFFSCNYGS